MKKYTFLFLLFILVAFAAHAQKQKVTVDDDTIKVDNQAYAILEKMSGMGFDFTVKSLDGKEQLFFKFLEFYDPQEVSSSNPKGRVTYFEVTFLNSGGKCEVMCPGTKKGVAKVVVENKLIKDNAVDADSERKFILINGTKYSERKKSLDGPKIIIIEK